MLGNCCQQGAMRAMVLQPLLKRYTATDVPVNHQKGALRMWDGDGPGCSQRILLTGVAETHDKTFAIRWALKSAI
jgi:hypothetical protein